MTWLAIRAFFGGAFGKLWGWLCHRSFWQLVSMALAAFALLQHFQLVGEHHHSKKLSAQIVKCTEGRQADRTAYTKAQDTAAVQNVAHNKIVEQQYQRNTDDERQAYLRDLAQLRAGGLRKQGAAAAARPAGHSDASAAPAPAAGADADGLFLSPDEHLQAAEIELRLMHLQNWVDKQLTVDPNR